jgi:simple sugar transport system ATP-binding protein
VLDLKKARDKVRELSSRFGFDIDPDAVVGELPVGVQQRVEIIKALISDAKVLVFDEPTAVLTPQETDELMVIMKQLRDAGHAIVFITHKLREVKEVADRITVLRLGKVVGEAKPTDTAEQLASMMVGRAVDLDVNKGAAKLGKKAFVIDGLNAWNEAGTQVLFDVSLEVHEGEILVIAGVQGNGQTELTEVILGAHARTSGSVSLDGINLLGKSIKQILDLGLGFVPEDRTQDGLVSEFTIAENLILDRSDRKPFAKGASIQPKVVREFAQEKLKQYDIRAQSIDSTAKQLSGGNQQKVVLARELSRDLRLLVASQPTRGLDVGSIEFVHDQIIATRDSGIPVVIVATELDEATQLGDRIAVMYRGKVVGVVPADTSRVVLGQMMAGVA